jgi:hypothetical protein
MAKLQSENRTHFFGAAVREDVIRMYRNLLDRIEALDKDMELADWGMRMDRLLAEPSTEMRRFRVLFHLLLCSCMGVFCYILSSAKMLFDLSTAIIVIVAISGTTNLILVYCRVVLFASPHFVMHFTQVWARTPLDKRDYICISFPFHDFWLLGQPLLLHHSDVRFRSKSNQVVPCPAPTPSHRSHANSMPNDNNPINSE